MLIKLQRSKTFNFLNYLKREVLIFSIRFFLRYNSSKSSNSILGILTNRLLLKSSILTLSKIKFYKY